MSKPAKLKFKPIKYYDTKYTRPGWTEARNSTGVPYNKELCPGTRTWVDSEKRKRVRCPECKRRLLLRDEVEDFGGYFIGFRIPPHKPKIKAKKK